jgi:hypothetical protein
MLFLGSRFWFLVFLWLRILGPWLCSKGIGICSYLYTKYWGIVCKVCVYYCRTYDKAVCVFYYRSGPITKMFACVPVPVCVFITAGPITKLFAGGDGTREEPGTLTQGAPVFPGSSRLGIEPKTVTPGWCFGLWTLDFGVLSSQQRCHPQGPKTDSRR